MTTKSHHIVASYDIHDSKRLLTVGKIMKDYGERVLKSVFECNLTDNRFLSMRARIDDVIDHMEDSVRYYLLCDKCVRNNEHSGLGEPFVEEEEVIIT